MSRFLDRPVSNPSQPGGGLPEFRFVPARWILVLAALARLVFKGGALGKLSVAGFVWSFAPRKFKLVALGLAGAMTIVLMGAVAAIVLLAMQIA